MPLLRPEPVTPGEPTKEDWLLSLDSMEGVYTLPVVELQSAAALAPPSPWPGYRLSGLTALIGYAVHYLPFAPFTVAAPSGLRRPVSSAIAAIVAGVLIRNLL